MKKLLKGLTVLSLLFILAIGFVACGTLSDKNNSNKAIAEKLELMQSTLDDVEFENAESVKINEENSIYKVSGTIVAMSKAQKSAFAVSDVTHYVALKFTFDKEKTISSFEIKGSTTKVYSDNKNVANYVGSITELLDNEEKEDSFCYLILSANTKEYTLTSTYSDKTTSTIKIKIDATLATATVD